MDERCAFNIIDRMTVGWYPQGDVATSVTKGRAESSSDQTDGRIFLVERAERYHAAIGTSDLRRLRSKYGPAR